MASVETWLILNDYLLNENYLLNERPEKVVLNGQYSPWAKLSAGIQQGFIVGSLLFLPNINEL